MIAAIHALDNHIRTCMSMKALLESQISLHGPAHEDKCYANLVFPGEMH